MKTVISRFLLVIGFAGVASVPLHAAEPPSAADYYTEPPVYNLRPDPKGESNFGSVGVTGLKLKIHPGVVLTVDGAIPGSPADGKFTKREIITGINGVAHKGHNPYVIFGEALTKAEAGDGKMVFDVLAAEGAGTKQVTVQIPVLGAYSKTWPLKCRKSQQIINQAAQYYAKHETGGVEGALRCLFLLSTGDDQYLPLVKTYLNKMGANVKAIGDCTWNRGYSGIACAEYYLRSGDKSVFPLLQHICDDAKEGQAYGIAWAHGTHRCNPGYMDGIMNPASTQLVTTLILAKECGVDVDDKTLISSLKYFYRFAGHGSVAYGDHRSEGLGSNGKDGMAAAIMQAASGAQGDVSIYQMARNAFAMPMLDSYVDLIRGHADDGRGDAIWRGIAASYLRDALPAAYQSHMDRLQWWYDLSRRPSGALGVSSCVSFDDEASGAGTVLAYTAPLKTLRITGAPRSKHAKDFKLPAHLWGRKADLDFLSIRDGKESGKAAEPMHVTVFKFADISTKPQEEVAKIPREEMIRYVYHHSYPIRSEAARALYRMGALDELERLLKDKDARVRRAALNGLADRTSWAADDRGRNRITPDKVTPGMLAAFRGILSDPQEPVHNVEGALMAMSCAPPPEIFKSLDLIRSWTTCNEWWLRFSAFTAIAAAAEDESIAQKVLPILGEMLWREDRSAPRKAMNFRMSQLAAKYKPDTKEGKQIGAIFRKSVDQTRIDPGFRGGAGAFYVKSDFFSLLETEPQACLLLAQSLGKRLVEIRVSDLAELTNKLLDLKSKLNGSDQQEMADLLYSDYRLEFLRRITAGEIAEEEMPATLDMISTLAQMKDRKAGWQLLGSEALADREWHFTTFNPLPKDALELKQPARFRDVTLPDELRNWHAPDFDDKLWTKGKAPVGTGNWNGTLDAYGPGDPNNTFANRSDWGDGEFLLMRTGFTADKLDYDMIRLRILAKQGCRIYLNGQELFSFGGCGNTPQYKPVMLDPNQRKLLKTGRNSLAVCTVVQFWEGLPPFRRGDRDKTPRLGQMDLYLEGLDKASILRSSKK